MTTFDDADADADDDDDGNDRLIMEIYATVFKKIFYDRGSV